VGYQWLTMRSKLVPFVNVASSYMQWILIGGILMNSFPGCCLSELCFFAAATIFSLVELNMTLVIGRSG
jgi:Zn-dependent membrane protease YugP